MDCFVASLLAMTLREHLIQLSNNERMRVHILAAPIARGLLEALPSSREEGAGKTGCTPHPRSRVQFAQTNAHTSIQVRRRHPGLPCAMVLRLTSCSPW